MLLQLAASDPHALALIFDLLDDPARVAAAAVSRGWRDTIRGDPRLWPTVVLRGSKAALRGKEYMLQDRGLSGGTAAREVASAITAWEVDARTRVLSRAARISARTERVRLEGFEDQADLVPGVLAVLPPGLTSLQLAAPCAGPVLGIVGERFTRLQRLTLACDGDAIEWAARGTAATVPLLNELELNYSIPTFVVDDGFLDKHYAVSRMPNEVAALLQGASRLQLLGLQLRYSPAVGQLWAALPALRHLRLVLFIGSYAQGHQDPGRVQAVQALQAATQLDSLHMSVTTSTYAEGNGDPDDDQWHEELGQFVQLPPMAGLPCLHSLDVGGLAVLPPDWRLLSTLRQLSARPLLPDEQPEAHSFDQPVTALAALTQLRLPAAHLTPALCELTGLRELAIKAGGQPLPSKATCLTSLTLLTLHEAGNVAAAPAPLPGHLLACLRRLNISCPPARQDAWRAMLRDAGAAAQMSINFLSS